ncbi:hypothetical protein [Acetivibrio clariflavus]|uniref:Uncharacterized protein n=1 Tax=Acetivibrio clariflavus (strain DSM 19732 / NBRC 101661 / EBR45) TaxID=720554 RepID=G8LVE7_ACECE|nr:hypothetical protein [Acetivibrio clariflavus]AEV68536.1 hypothetical protein Clocl_1934 [Acetivibrio clariflavus DSM 19732]
MAIKPVDFQVQIPKVNEVAKIQSETRHKNELIEQQQSMINRQNAQNSVNLVHARENAQQAKISERQSKESKEKKEKGNKKKKNNNNGNSAKEDRTSVIDIKI